LLGRFEEFRLPHVWTKLRLEVVKLADDRIEHALVCNLVLRLNAQYATVVCFRGKQIHALVVTLSLADFRARKSLTLLGERNKIPRKFQEGIPSLIRTERAEMFVEVGGEIVEGSKKVRQSAAFRHRSPRK
jgi:hypothetical protein